MPRLPPVTKIILPSNPKSFFVLQIAVFLSGDEMVGGGEVFSGNAKGAGIGLSLRAKATNRFQGGLITEKGEIGSVPAFGLLCPMRQIYIR
jgi:hypothetical protein